MKFHLALIVAGLFAGPAHAELFVMHPEGAEVWYPVIAKSEGEAREIGRIFYNVHFSWGRPYDVVAHSCKPGGWWATIQTQTGRAGACNHANRLAAKRAAVAACKRKSPCAKSLDSGDLYSGLDDPAFDGLKNAKVLQDWNERSHSLLLHFPVSARQENCVPVDGRNGSREWKCFLPWTASNYAENDGPKGGELLPFDPNDFGVSPWDKSNEVAKNKKKEAPQAEESIADMFKLPAR